MPPSAEPRNRVPHFWPSVGRMRVHSDGRENRLACLCILLTALLAVAPMLARGFSCGNDLTFHMQSWMEATDHWRQGVFYPRWAATPAWGAGEPRFIFYPPLSWMLGAVLGAVIGWNAAPFVFVCVVLCAAGFSMWRFARHWLPPRGAVMAACLYVANPYTLFVIYTRAAMAELLAAALLPWLLSEALRPRLRVWALGIAVAGVWLANAPAAVMASYALALLLATRAIQERGWRTARQGASGVCLGLLLASFYILPAAYEKRWVQITQVLSGAYDFHANFLFGGMGDPLHDLLLRHVSWIAVSLFAVTLLAVGLQLRSGALRPVLIPALVLAVVIAFLLLPPSGFLWASLPQLRFLQFPWRWLAILAPLYAFAAAAIPFAGETPGAPYLPRRWADVGFAAEATTALPQETKRPNHAWPAAVTALACVLSVILSYAYLQQSCDPEDTPAGIRAQYLSGNGFEGTDEYVPRSADPDDLRPDPEHSGYPRVWLYRDDSADGTADKPESEDQADDSTSNAPEDHVRMAAPVDITRWDAEHKAFTVHASRAAIAIVQLEDYPAWSVRVDGRPAAKAQPATSGQMQIPLLDGDHTVVLDFRQTPDRTLADVLSCIALLVIACVWQKERRAKADLSSPPEPGEVRDPAAPVGGNGHASASIHSGIIETDAG